MRSAGIWARYLDRDQTARDADRLQVAFVAAVFQVVDDDVAPGGVERFDALRMEPVDVVLQVARVGRGGIPAEAAFRRQVADEMLKDLFHAPPGEAVPPLRLCRASTARIQDIKKRHFVLCGYKNGEDEGTRTLNIHRDRVAL